LFRKQKDNKINKLVLLFSRKLVSQSAFTIAEVLVTLLIVGVVASAVIPPIVRGAADKQFVVMYKKDYSLVSAWFNTAVNETGGNVPVLVAFWDVNAYLASIVQYFPDRILKSKPFYTGAITDYYNPGVMKWSTGAVMNVSEKGNWPHSGSYILNLANGSTVMIMQWASYADARAPIMAEKAGLLGWLIMIDVNGSRPPNTFGRDIFVVMPYQDGVIRPYISTVPCGSGCGQGCSYEKLDD
jgi:prepilin-type N-terminal cleavage/methylation domain-containing protein